MIYNPYPKGPKGPKGQKVLPPSKWSFEVDFDFGNLRLIWYAPF